MKDEQIRWADYCKYWNKQQCIACNKLCPWSDIGGYPINQECQFYENNNKNLTKD